MKTYSVQLMKDEFESWSDPGACIIEKTDICEVEDAAPPCYPDCKNNPPWTIMKDHVTKLEDCSIGGVECYIKISYVQRLACPPFNNQDIQITKIEKFNKTNDPNKNCDNCTDDVVYEQAAGAIIANNAMGFQPLLIGDCNTTYRISKASCWSEWEEISWDATHGITRYITIHKPCNSDCCMRGLEVCRIANNQIEMRDLGVLADYSDCDGIIYHADYPPPTGQDIPCTYTCDMLDDIDEIFYSKLSEEESEEIIKEFEKPKNGLHCQINVTNSDSHLKVQIQETNANSVLIDIHDINGNLIIKENGVLDNGLNSFEINISDLNNGVYVYSIIIDGFSLKTGKFNIVK